MQLPEDTESLFVCLLATYSFSRDFQGCIIHLCIFKFHFEKRSFIIFVYHCIMQYGPESLFVCPMVWQQNHTPLESLFKQLQGYIF